MKKYCLLTLVFIFSVIFPVFAEQVEVRIRYYDKKIYYTDSPVNVKLEIINNSPDTFRFKSSELRCFNFEFDVKTLTNKQLNHSTEFIMDRSTNQQVFFREMSLAPGETYSIIMELSDFVDISEAGVFVLNTRFYPELYTNESSAYFVSNNLTLNLRPAASTAEIQDLIDYETGEIIKANPVPPDEVIDYTLSSRQKSQWNKFLLYLDLEGLYLRSPANAERYRRLSQQDRLIEIEKYRNLLLNETVDTDIAMIPLEYDILRTTYTDYEAEVKVVERFQYSGFIEIKEYIYFLHRDNDIWYIYDYNVRNLGTE
ncbi:MAG: hypothetical protein PQJ61_10280 [Spirochaetales bacterium]|uniref:Uncharacterized protein n=1 Tax=Candidatus Thalassospirochaeta sargassi TaxID=3119039 RepID=A0AAJ1IJ63_9SPIO|nr:hypothetical protein [Spirochaetales bacterium]